MCPKCNEVYFYEKWRRRFDTQREDVKKEKSEWCTTSQEVSDAIRSWNKQGSVITRASKGSSVQLLSRVQLFGPHRLQHARLPCISPIPEVYLNSCLSSEWCHATILSSVTPFSSCPQSFPASGFFPMSQFFTSNGQSIGVSASASVLPMNIRTDFL